MHFDWVDYSAEFADLIDSWLDDAAVAMTGIDSCWDNYWHDVMADSENYPGCIDYCKVVKLNDTPVGVVVFGCFRGVVTISEILIDPLLRSKGYGTQMIRELIRFSDAWFPDKIDRFTAIVFLQNIHSQKAFQKAGFLMRLMNDGSAYECIYMPDRQ